MTDTQYSNVDNGRTYKKRIEAGRKNMSEQEVLNAKNKRCAQRNQTRKKERLIAETKRRENWQRLTPQQQLAELDRRLGKGVGAGKQRKKIQDLIDNPPKKVEVFSKETVVKHKGNHQQYQKKQRSFNRHQNSE